MKPLSSYIDFREYLRDYYQEQKKSCGLTYRKFCKKAGFSSPVFLKLVIEGKANLSGPSITALCAAMGLKKAERKIFRSLVLFGQAKDIESKMRHLDALRSASRDASVSRLRGDQFEYFSKWYHPVIKELLDMGAFDGNYEALGAMVYPRIGADEAEASVALLRKLDLVKEENGRLRATQQFLTTDGTAIESLAVRSVQKKMASLAAQAVDEVAPENRDISGVSVAVSRESMAKISEEIGRCRKRIMEIAGQDQACDRVYRLNLQLFPVSRTVPVFKPGAGAKGKEHE
ncbi:MAG: TIGR02147 family protein [Chitinispirillaceae bacterium]|nr:TIGR02147 family protein [Chitinispirillaceae bacterium]